MNIMVVMYAGIVDRGRISINDVPEIYRDDVKAFLDGKSKDENDVLLEPQPEIVQSGKLGALYIPKTTGYELNIQKLKLGMSCKFTSDLFFTEEILNGNPYPENLTYDIIMFEQTSPYVLYPEVTITPAENGFNLNLQATVCKEKAGLPILRVDVKFISDNYEDMRTSIYFVEK